MIGDPGPLKKALEEAVGNAVSGKRIAVAFSGGLDSGIVAAFAKEHAEEATLYTVGSENSHDIKEALTSAEELGMRPVTILITEDDVMEGLREMIRLTGTKDPVTLSFELPLFHVCKNCEEDEILSGLGADELFAGYSKYIGLGKDDLRKSLEEDTRKLLENTLPHERRIAEHFGKRMFYPFLDDMVVKEARSLEMSGAVPTDDPMSRKRPLREVSDMIGCHGISAKEKKAAQYGSGSMGIIRKVCRKNNITYAELIEAICKEVG
ncbi:MAG: asparagine synthase [Candidatus Methanoplasma sp.]|jgi:asparagine synthase (glutamine-hydrolysing)|nr:asparagine synthase [Candidatus Methanoplasma sp.]